MDGQGQDTKQQPKKLFTAELKAKIMREHLEGGVPLSTLAEKYQVHMNSLYQWKKQLFENAAAVFSGKQEKTEARDQAEIEKLKAELQKKDTLIADLVEDNMALKKSTDGGR